ncbi:MAG: hypothetical protein U1F20_09650 [Lysobacterales bacterium]
MRELTRECDLVLVVGSPNSSNSNRLRELAEREGVEAHADRRTPAGIDPAWVEGRASIGVTAGDLHPGRWLVQGVLEQLGAASARGRRAYQAARGRTREHGLRPAQGAAGQPVERRPAAGNCRPCGIAQLVERRIRNA